MSLEQAFFCLRGSVFLRSVHAQFFCTVCIYAINIVVAFKPIALPYYAFYMMRDKCAQVLGLNRVYTNASCVLDSLLSLVLPG